MKDSIFDSGMSRGFAPVKSARILPLSPTKSIPSVGKVFPSVSSSSKRSGFRPPSYQ